VILKGGGPHDVRARVRAVAVNVGVQDPGDAPVVDALGELRGVLTALLLPALDGDLPVAGIDCDDRRVR
jgi:hypothetical protein